MSTDEKIERLRRTWVDLLLQRGDTAAAAIAVECEWEMEWIRFNLDGNTIGYLNIDLPLSSYDYVKSNKPLEVLLSQTAFSLAKEHLEGFDWGDDKFTYVGFRRKLTPLDDDWQNVIKRKIAEGKASNQALITEKVGLRNGRPPLEYNELKYASKSEIRIAQELESRNVLFFPLPVAVKAETGSYHKDHREPDFLVCVDGCWGILEVAYHPDRYETDKEKDAWFKREGVLCVEHYTAERCYNNPEQVVDEFLNVLKMHKR